MPDLRSDIAADFVVESGEIVDRLGQQLLELERRRDDVELLHAIFRGFHTLKGGAGFLRLGAIVQLCHAAEDVFDRLRAGVRALDGELLDHVLRALDELRAMLASLRAGAAPAPAPQSLLDALHAAAGAAAGAVPGTGPRAAAPAGKGAAPSDDEFEALLDALHGKGSGPGAPRPPVAPAPEPPATTRVSPGHAAHETSVRVATRRLDAIMNLVGELVLTRNRLKNLRHRTQGIRRRAADVELDRAIGTLDHLTGRLQSAVMRARMQPVGRVFARFPTLARELARTLAKEVRLELIGEETELDRTIVEALAEPLLHLVRNAIDHGIEPPALREQRGKPRQGKVQLAARHEGDHIVIEVRDDGAGVDPEMLRSKAREKGLLSPAALARLTHDECLNLIFLPGFSTRSEVSEISGRGVGMDVVKARLVERNGHVSLHTRLGEGTTVRIRLPLTLAILTALVVQSAGRPYAIALNSVDRVFRFEPQQCLWIDGQQALDVDGSALPLVHLRRWLGRGAEASAGCVVVVRCGDLRYGLVVDDVRGRDEVVVKPLPRALRALAGFAGATITGDGAIALILDAHGVFRARERGR